MSAIDVGKIALVLLVLAGLNALAMLCWRRKICNAEMARKLVHIGMGLVVLSFAWIFTAPLAVWLLAAGAILFLALQKSLPFLQKKSALLQVERAQSSLGEFYFPLAVAGLFQLSAGDKLLFVVPILLLTFADAVAALLGKKFASEQYFAFGATKSLLGTLVFCGSALIILLVCFVFFATPISAQILLLCLLLALVAAGIEALGTRGLDNLLIPLASFLLLRHYLTLDLAELAMRVLVILALAGLAFCLRKQTILSGGALIGAILFSYACFALGGWHFLLTPILYFFSGIWCYQQQKSTLLVDAEAVASVSIVGLAWLVGKNSQLLPAQLCLLGFSLSLALHSACAFFLLKKPQRKTIYAIGRGIILLAPIVFFSFAISQIISALMIFALLFGFFVLVSVRMASASSQWLLPTALALVPFFSAVIFYENY